MALGFPEQMVKAIVPILETTPFWGEQHWLEQDGFWVWWTSVTSREGEFPQKELTTMLETIYLAGFNRAAEWLMKNRDKLR